MGRVSPSFIHSVDKFESVVPCGQMFIPGRVAGYSNEKIGKNPALQFNSREAKNEGDLNKVMSGSDKP